MFAGDYTAQPFILGSVLFELKLVKFQLNTSKSKKAFSTSFTISFPISVCSHRRTPLPPLSVCLSVSSCPSTHLSFSLPLRSLTGLYVARLSGHYMHHLFARCYCLHCGDFIRCSDNFINLGGNQTGFFFVEKTKMERKRRLRI